MTTPDEGSGAPTRPGTVEEIINLADAFAQAATRSAIVGQTPTMRAQSAGYVEQMYAARSALTAALGPVMALVEAAVEWDQASSSGDNGRWMQAVTGLHYAVECLSSRAPAPAPAPREVQDE